ncbi:MAG TPA: O-antigen ligase family protein [Solirubrobacteraceae bacterium]|jgi:hypothetical protein|nr:O-antigen ligase family protein [Solirubrobacteraceae bacterium]
MAIAGGVAPSALLLILIAVLAARHGGYAATAWYPAGLTALAILVVASLLSQPRRHERSPLVERALAAYAVFCVLGLASTLWADVPGQAWDSANRAVVYGIALAIVALRPWSHRAAVYALLAVAVVVAGVAAGTLIDTAHGDPARVLLQGRLSLPFGYANATADFWLIGFWPALWLACEPQLLWPLRGLALGISGLLLETALLSQSRGAVIGFVLTALMFIALVPRRWPALLALAGSLAAAALAWGTLAAVHDEHRVGALGGALTEARRAIVVSAVVLAVLGGLLALLDQAVLARGLHRRGMARLANRLLVGLAALAAIAGLAVIGDPVSWIDARYHDFKTSGYTQVESGASRFTGSLGSNRYDFYRVSLDEFSSHPVAGIGAENFAVPYLRHRRSPETPQYPHSFAFGLLAGLGLLGAVVFLCFLGLVLRAWSSAIRSLPWPSSGVSVAALAAFAMFFLHGLADWLWQFPALGMLAFGLLGLAVRCGHPPEPAPPFTPQERLAATARSGRRLRALAPRALMAATVLVLAVSLALPGIAARLTDTAYHVSAGDPALALSRLQRAASLNFLRSDALLAEGLIAQAQGRVDEARSAFTRALQREPQNWYAHLELGILSSNRGDRATALEQVTRAARLNPRQPVIDGVRSQVASGQSVDPAAVNAQLDAQLADKLRPTG